MVKATTSNFKGSALDLFIANGIAEIEMKGKAETKGSLAFACAILACDDPETRTNFTNRLANMADADEKMKSKARDAFAAFIKADTFLVANGDKEHKSQDYRNLINRQQRRMQFACDVFKMGVREFVIITQNSKNEPTNAFIKGGSELAALIWSKLDWANKAGIKDKRSPMQDIPLVQRASDRGVGEVSWSQLVDVVAEVNGRKPGGNSNVKPVTVKSSPIAALQLVKEIAKRDGVETSFTAVESRMLALETAEDVAAFAFEGEDMEDARDMLNKAFEKAREILQGKINAKVKLQTAA